MTTSKILSLLGLSLDFVGGFLLAVEAIRVARVIRSAELLRMATDTITSSAGRRDPLPLTWKFAAACLVFSVVAWVFAPYLLVFAVTPTLFVVVFIVHRFLKWSIAVSADGYAAVVGFALFTIGAALQIAGVALGN